MKELPILFKSEMVRAALREIDPKDQTRRIINKLRKFGKITEFGISDTPGYDWHFRDKEMRWNDISHERLLELCPYGQPGDRLWVKETWRGQPDYDTAFSYRADWSSSDEKTYPKIIPWKASIFMPRCVSRITLEITNVRLERLQDINEEDARAEGVLITDEWTGCADDLDGSYVKAYRILWERINGAGSLAANPWVWVIGFRKIQEQT